MVKIGGTYYLFGSHLTGWSTNDNQYSTGTSITGTWSAWKSFAPSGSNTCNSESTSILPVSGSSGTSCLFLADRWNANSLWDSRHIWEPLTISGTSVSITCRGDWTVDAVTGLVGAGGAVVRGVGSNRCLDVPNSYLQLVARHSGKCLDVAGAGTGDGVDIQQYTCGGGTNQQWSRTVS
jgi:ricin-type beta-trefoil lectin protein